MEDQQQEMQNEIVDNNEQNEGVEKKRYSTTLLQKLQRAVQKVNEHHKSQKLIQKSQKIKSNLSAQSIINSISDKRAQQLRSRQMQEKLEEFEKLTNLDFEDKEICSVYIIYSIYNLNLNQLNNLAILLTTSIIYKYKVGDLLTLKANQESTGNIFFRKVYKNDQCIQSKRGIVVSNIDVQQNHLEFEMCFYKEISQSFQIWQNYLSYIISHIFAIIFQIDFKYFYSQQLLGDKGNEYFILLQGKAYCLVPYSNMYPLDDILAQTRQKRLTPQATEDASDEDFLFENFKRFQCVKIYQPGEAFGEIALLTTESKRMASIVCKEDSWFMSLNREGFNQIQGSYQQHLLNEKVYFLKKFDIFKPIAINKILSFLHECVEKSYKIGQAIYSQGQKDFKLYFLMEGEIEIKHEMTSVGTSKMNNQKYEMYFRNTKFKNLQKQIVLLGSDNYFGDEDLFQDDKIHQFSAICKSQTCKLLVFEIKTLAAFLKIYDMFTMFKKTSLNKRARYQQIIQEDIVLDKHRIIDGLDSSRFQNPNRDEDEYSSIYYGENRFGNENTQNDNKKLSSSLVQLSPLNSDRNHYNELGSNKQGVSLENLKCIPKFHNVFNHVANQNIRSKNYLNLGNTYQSTVKFTIEDVPMTTRMNQDEGDLKRIQIRLNKNKSVENKTMPQIPHQNQKMSALKTQISKFTSTQKGSYFNIPSLSITSKSVTKNQFNKLNATESDQNKVQIINLNQMDSLKIEESFNDRKKDFLFNLKAKQQNNSPSQIQDNVINSASSPKSKFQHYFTPQHSNKSSSINIDSFTKRSQMLSSRDQISSFIQNRSAINLKHSKNVNDYQENLIQRKKQNTVSIPYIQQ